MVPNSGVHVSSPRNRPRQVLALSFYIPQHPWSNNILSCSNSTKYMFRMPILTDLCSTFAISNAQKIATIEQDLMSGPIMERVLDI